MSAADHVLRTLSEFEPMTHLAYSEIAGIKPRAASKRIRALWDAGVLYIAKYERSAYGPPAPLYAIGRLPDATEKPAPYTDAEKTARYQATEKGRKNKAKHAKKKLATESKRRASDPVYAERLNAKNRMRYQAKAGAIVQRRPLVDVAKFDPLLAVMMGIKPKTKGAKEK